MKNLTIVFCLFLSVFIYAENVKFSSQIGYTIEIPSDWTAELVYQRQSNWIEKIVEHVLVSNAEGAYISIDTWKSHPKLELKLWLNMMEDTLKLEGIPCQETTATVKKLPAMCYTFSAEKVQSFNSQITLFKYADKVFRITYLERDGGKATPVYQQILQTFSFEVCDNPIPPVAKKTKVESRVYTCGNQSDVCQCNASNPYPCCDNGGNCTWWAWHSACCNWGIGLPSPWRHAKYWAGDLRSHGYNVTSYARVGTIACRDTGTYGHVAWVLEVSGSKVRVSEMNCCSGCNYGAREYWYDASYYTGGYISR